MALQGHYCQHISGSCLAFQCQNIDTCPRLTLPVLAAHTIVRSDKSWLCPWVLPGGFPPQFIKDTIGKVCWGCLPMQTVMQPICRLSVYFLSTVLELGPLWHSVVPWDGFCLWLAASPARWYWPSWGRLWPLNGPVITLHLWAACLAG